jgi:hypothetical protein
VFFGLWLVLAWRRETWRRQLLVALVVGIGAFLIFLPWLLNTFAGPLAQLFANTLVKPPTTTRMNAMTVYNGLFDFREFMPLWLWLAVLGSIGWALWRQQRRALAVILWCGALFFVANPQWLALPGQGDINNFTVQIFSYGPAAVLLAMLGEIRPGPRWRVGWRALGIAGGIALCAWGGYQRSMDLRPFERILVTRPDLRAMAWIRQNLPADGLLLVNGRSELGLYDVGSDGAWLTPLLTGRQVTFPPMIYPNEKLSTGWNKARIEASVEAVRKQAGGDASWLTALQATGARYIFVGQRHGKVLNNEPMLDVESLATTPGLRVVYHQDQVWIFAAQL